MEDQRMKGCVAVDCHQTNNVSYIFEFTKKEARLTTYTNSGEELDSVHYAPGAIGDYTDYEVGINARQKVKLRLLSFLLPYESDASLEACVLANS